MLKRYLYLLISKYYFIDSTYRLSLIVRESILRNRTSACTGSMAGVHDAILARSYAGALCRPRRQPQALLYNGVSCAHHCAREGPGRCPGYEGGPRLGDPPATRPVPTVPGRIQSAPSGAASATSPAPRAPAPLKASVDLPALQRSPPPVARGVLSLKDWIPSAIFPRAPR